MASPERLEQAVNIVYAVDPAGCVSVLLALVHVLQRFQDYQMIGMYHITAYSIDVRLSGMNIRPHFLGRYLSRSHRYFRYRALHLA